MNQNRKVNISGALIPPMSEQFLEKLLTAFKPMPVDPDTPMNKIQFAAGQQSVLRWVLLQLNRRDTLHEHELRVLDPEPQHDKPE